jgi:hypothetical protein
MLTTRPPKLLGMNYYSSYRCRVSEILYAGFLSYEIMWNISIRTSKQLVLGFILSFNNHVAMTIPTLLYSSTIYITPTLSMNIPTEVHGMF